MAALLDVEEPTARSLGWHSLGGYLSLSFHIAHSERVKALVLIDTGPGYRDDKARAGWNRFVDREAAALAAVHGEAIAARMMLHCRRASSKQHGTQRDRVAPVTSTSRRS